MKRRQIEDIYELSPVQQGMLFHTLYDPESGVYLQQWSCALHGSLNPLALERAWQQVVERHSILRTSFHWEELEKPLQVVHRSAALRIEQHDWRQIDPLQQEARLDAYLQEDCHRAFDLSQAPLMRLALIRRAEDLYQLIWTHHQLLLDGWSGSLLFQEVAARYEALCRGEELPWQQSRPYGDYIEWLQQQDLSGAEVFWREALHGFNTPTPLVVDRDISVSRGEAAQEEQWLRVPHTTTAALQALARQHQLTLNTFVQGAWALLLGRYSGEEEVIFGVTSAGRPPSLPGVESMVGLFINTLPLRVRLPSEAPLLPWLKALQAQQFELREYEYCPLVEIQGWSGVPRGVPLFESILVFQNYPIDRSLGVWNGTLKLQQARSTDRTNYPLTIIAAPGAELSLRINYDSARFDRASIRRMLGHLRTLLEGMVVDPFQRLSRLPLLTAGERQQLLVECNPLHPSTLFGDTRRCVDALRGYPTGIPRDQCLQQLFEAQVERSPDATAVVFEGERLTYRELNQRANQLAHHLRTLGVEQEVLVGLCVDRSLEMVVGLLGILKAGGAYLPLDPAYPKERLAFMLADSDVPLVLTHERLASRLPAGKARIVRLDADRQQIERHRKANLPCLTGPDGLAYVIYTSGSTGTSKGVMISHANVTRLFTATQAWFRFDEHDVWTLFHSIAFDFSVWEIWGALLHGGRLVVVPYATSRSPQAFYDLLVDEQVTVLNQTPTAFRQLQQAEAEAARSEPGAAPLALRLVIFGGEAVDPPSLKPWFARHGDQRPQLVNMYGITETTVHVTYRPLTAADARGESGSVIGRPIPDLSLYLLDAHQQPVPIGVPGEICVGGAGLARGYLNRPALTQERFIPDPFSNAEGARLYRSGDLARYRPDGNLEFMGRRDHQVKLRGYRIELGEIEAVLTQHPAVREGVVLPREDRPGDRRLVAYLVPDREEALTTAGMRDFLQEKLPEYMVPSALVVLEALPLTPSGKIDRRALPEPDPVRPDLAEPFVAPRTPVEERLAAIWAEVLRLERVGVHDNFFELGGHSLLATQIISRVRTAFPVELPLRSLFDAPTVSGLSVALTERLVEGAEHAPMTHLLVELEQLPDDTGVPEVGTGTG